MIIKTDVLKELVIKAGKGIGNNKLIPITSLMGIKADGEWITITTTDGTNYLYIKEKLDSEEFNVTIDADKFSKLVSKLTCENVTLTLKDKSLEVVGNGTYNIELPLDESGELIDYPNPLETFDEADSEKTVLDLSTIQLILNSVKPSLAETTSVPCYTGYYFGENVIATDSFKIASLDRKLFSTPTLLSREFVDLLSILDTEPIRVLLKNNVIVVKSYNCDIYGRVMNGIEDFQIDAISKLLESDFDNVCKVSKQELLQVLDRLSLFVNMYDKNAITLNWTPLGLEISSKTQSGIETLNYLDDNETFTPFECLVNISLLQAQVKAQSGDEVEIYYGKSNCIKLKDIDTTYIVALLSN